MGESEADSEISSVSGGGYRRSSSPYCSKLPLASTPVSTAMTSDSGAVWMPSARRLVQQKVGSLSINAVNQIACGEEEGEETLVCLSGEEGKALKMVQLERGSQPPVSTQSPRPLHHSGSSLPRMDKKHKSSVESQGEAGYDMTSNITGRAER